MVKDIIENNENILPNQKELNVLKEHFPACFKNDGSFDIERFKEYLSDKIEVSNEGYELKFLGKNYARLLASLDTETVIVPDEEHNNKPENKDSQNIYISGDNLDALKHLLKSYTRKVKCIYIDPPYNTGNDGFVYNDSFNFTAEELEAKLGIDENQAKRILDFTSKGSASHSAWLMFMYPRLLLARDLLTDDGAVFISIDENEQSDLKLICDDVFGEVNFIGQWNWLKSTTPPALSKKIKRNIEYIIAYSKCNNNSNFYGVQKVSPSTDPITKPQNTIKSLVFPSNSIKVLSKTNLIKAGTYGTEKTSFILHNDIIVKDGTNVNEVRFSSRFIWEQVTLERFLSEGTAIFLSKNGVLSFKKANYSPEVPPNFIDDTVGVGTTEQAGADLAKLFGGKSVFDYPKPVSLIYYLCNFFRDNQALVLDFFSGSATTAHAVMQMNAEDQGQRRFILVQIPEKTNEDSKAWKEGYQTIDQIGIERIIRASEAIKKENPNTTADLGFRHFTLKEPSAETLDKLENFEPESGLLLQNTILQDFGVPTVLVTWLVRDGYGFTAPVQEIDFAGYKAYYIDKHLYLINDIQSCFDKGSSVNEQEVITAIVDKIAMDSSINPENVVLFGYNFLWTTLEELKQNLSSLKDTEKNIRINFDVRY